MIQNITMYADKLSRYCNLPGRKTSTEPRRPCPIFLQRTSTHYIITSAATPTIADSTLHPHAQSTMCTCWSLLLSKISLESTQQFRLLCSRSLGIHTTHHRTHYAKNDVIHKTLSTQHITMPPEEDQAMAIGNMHKQIWCEVQSCGLWDMWVDRHRQTHSSQYLAQTRGEVIRVHTISQTMSHQMQLALTCAAQSDRAFQSAVLWGLHTHCWTLDWTGPLQPAAVYTKHTETHVINGLRSTTSADSTTHTANTTCISLTWMCTAKCTTIQVTSTTI